LATLVKYDVIEGEIEQLKPKELYGHGSGIIVVDEHTFYYFNNALASALQTNISGFGPAKLGSIAKIVYMRDYNGETQILRIELQQQDQQPTPVQGPGLQAPTGTPFFSWPQQ
jgi:hypothetical protein